MSNSNSAYLKKKETLWCKEKEKLENLSLDDVVNCTMKEVLATSVILNRKTMVLA